MTPVNILTWAAIADLNCYTLSIYDSDDASSVEVLEAP